METKVEAYAFTHRFILICKEDMIMQYILGVGMVLVSWFVIVLCAKLIDIINEKSDWYKNL